MSSRSIGKMFVLRYLTDLLVCRRLVDGLGSVQESKTYKTIIKPILIYTNFDYLVKVKALVLALVKAEV